MRLNLDLSTELNNPVRWDFKLVRRTQRIAL